MKIGKVENTWVSTSTSSKPLKKKMEQAEAHGKEQGNGEPQKINRALEALSLEDEGEKDIDIDDKPIEATMVINEDKTHFSDLESNPTLSMNSFNIYLNLPDVPFNMLIMTLSTTDLRRLTQVSFSWKKRITEIFLENPANRKTLRARIERVMGPGMLPSNEEITNAMWSSKYHLSLTVV